MFGDNNIHTNEEINSGLRDLNQFFLFSEQTKALRSSDYNLVTIAKL